MTCVYVIVAFHCNILCQITDEYNLKARGNNQVASDIYALISHISEFGFSTTTTQSARIESPLI